MFKHTLDLAAYTEDDLNALPFGVIHLDERGNILDYNSWETKLSGMLKDEVIGKNFFAHIAPCTDVPEFYARFAAGMKSANLNESFTFAFPFHNGPRRVLIQMMSGRMTKTAWIFVADSSQVINLELDDTRTLTLWQVSGASNVLKPSDA